MSKQDASQGIVISLRLSKRLLERVDRVVTKRGRSGYVRRLIEADLKKNAKSYKSKARTEEPYDGG